jgi:hypothetical protein
VGFFFARKITRREWFFREGILLVSSPSELGGNIGNATKILGINHPTSLGGVP